MNMEKITLQLHSSSCVPKITKQFLFHHPYPQQWLPPPKRITFTFKFITISTPTNPSQFLRPNCRRWDSNAENFRTQNFNFNSDALDDDDDDEDEEDESSEEWSNVLEEFIGQAWIFKVFRSYGWMLPIIIASLLLASGLKAFLLTLAIPFAQSALAFAFQKVQRRTQNKRKSKAKAWKKTRGTAPKYVDLNEEKGERGRSGKGKMGYQTWAAGNDVIDKSREESPSFGGWEELDGGRDTRLQETGSSHQTAEMKRRILRNKLSRREGRRTDTPLLLRLLIAVFPFLSSWTRML